MPFVLTYCLLLFAAAGQKDMASAQVNKYRTNISIENGVMTQSVEISIQINNPKGDRFSKVVIGYSKGNRIKKLDASVSGLFGQEIKSLKKKDIIDRSSISDISLYEDDYVKEFTLKHGQYPYVLTYSYTQEFDEFLGICSWNPIFRNQPTLNASLQVDIPSDYDINIHEQNISKVNTIQLGNERVQYTWKENDLEPMKREVYGPPIEELLPKVEIHPVQFEYGISGSAKSWKDYGQWVYDLGSECNDLSEEQIGRLRKIVGETKDSVEIVKILYNTLQDEMRYVNVSIDIGGMKPYPASYVAQNRYGDCKALTYYMMSSLEIFGIQSFAVDVYWDRRSYVLSETPGQQFNHVFLAVPLNKDTLWLENTSDTQPFNYIDVQKQGNKALWIENRNSSLMTLATKNPSDVFCSNRHYYELEDNLLKVHTKGIARGQLFEQLKSLSFNYNSKDQYSILNSYFLDDNSELLSYDISISDRNSDSLAFELKINQNGLIKKYGPNKVVNIPKSDIPKLEPPSQRAQRVDFLLPIYKRDTYHYDLTNTDFGTKILGENVVIDSSYGSYSVEFQETETGLICQKELKILSGVYPIGESYEGFYEFLDQIKKTESKTYFTLKP